MSVAYYTGQVENVVMSDMEQSFYIVKMLLDSPTGGRGSSVTVCGNIPGLRVSVGTWLGFEASWTEHARFGKQLKITRAPVMEEWTPDTAQKALSGVGVGPTLVARIRKELGDDRFLDGLGDVSLLCEVEDINAYTADFIVQKWLATKSIFQVTAFLSSLGLSPARVRAVWGLFEANSEEVVREDPWALMQVQGLNFATADKVARLLGVPFTHPNRLKAAVILACQDHSNQGHLFATSGSLVDQVRTYTEDATSQGIAIAIKAGLEAGNLVLDRDTRPGTMAIYSSWSHMLEVESARLLQARLASAHLEVGGKYEAQLRSMCQEAPAESLPLRDLAVQVVDEWSVSAKFQFSPAQKEGVVNALVDPVTVITGLPGTGKTSSLQALVRILQDAGIPLLLLAPTGIAAKRLQSVTGVEAFTIHRAFEARGGDEDARETVYAGIVGKAVTGPGQGGSEGAWGFDEDRPHTAQVVIIDESSMLDQHLFYRLLNCTSPQCRLVFVGDAAQLPSVGPGNVLRDLIKSEAFTSVNLTEIFRQADTSQIVFASHDVFNGRVPDTEASKEFTLLARASDQEVQDTILELAQAFYEAQYNFQVLSPRHGGKIGVTELNSKLRHILNPPNSSQQEIKIGADVIRVGDRIMVTKNNYDMGIFNGDVGKIQRIGTGKDREILIKIHGTPPLQVSMKVQDAFSCIRLAYACTIHKMQGSEVDRVIIPCVLGFSHQLMRNLYYTAITRARRQVVLVGHLTALAQAVANDKEDMRNTMFLDRLKTRPSLEG